MKKFAEIYYMRSFKITTKTAATIGSVYFLLLGSVNFFATGINAEIHSLDVITLLVCALPFVIRKKLFLSIFGVITALISLYCFFVGLAFSLDPLNRTSGLSFFMGFLLIGSAFVSSLLLIYAGGSASPRDITVTPHRFEL